MMNTENCLTAETTKGNTTETPVAEQTPPAALILPTGCTNSTTSKSANSKSTNSTSIATIGTPKRKRGYGFSSEEMINLFGIMLEIEPIGPDEWSSVLDNHSILYPGRSVESLRRKYNDMHRKKAPTGDPNMPQEIRLAKEAKRKIGDKAQLVGGEDEYDLMENTFSGDNDLPDISVFVEETNNGNNEIPESTTTSTATATPINDVSPTMTSHGLIPRKNSGGKKPDFMDLMMMQMQSEASAREFERRERAEDRRQFMDLMGTVVGKVASSYFENKNKKRKKKRKGNKHKKKSKLDCNDVSSSSSIDSDSSDSDSS